MSKITIWIAMCAYAGLWVCWPMVTYKASITLLITALALFLIGATWWGVYHD